MDSSLMTAAVQPAGSMTQPPPTIYLPRSSYRSVAFGTWKYGEASRLFSKKSSSDKEASGKCDKPVDPLCLTKSLDSKCISSRVAVSGVAVPQASTSKQPTTPLDKAKLNRKSLCFSLDNLSEGAAPPASLKSPLHASQQSGGSLGSLVNLLKHKFQSSQTADCYSSTEYVKYCSQNVYENLIVDSRLCPQQSPFNHSMNALHERLRDCSAPCSRKKPEQMVSPPPSTTTSQAPYFVIDPCCSFGTLGRSSANSPEIRARTKSLDNTTKWSVLPRRRAPVQKVELSSKTEQQAMTTSSSVATSTLLSAKRFLRKLYNSSTQKFRINNTAVASTALAEKCERKISNNEKFQFATSPFFEIRLPEPEERPFLPYNIHYQVDEDESVERQQPPAVLSPSPRLRNTSKHLRDSTTNYTSSPDEGVYCSSSASSSANSSILNSRTHQEPGIRTMAPVVPHNFEDFLDLSTAAISPVQGHQIVPVTPPQSSLGYATMSTRAREAFDDCRSVNTSFASACNTTHNNCMHQSMTTVSEPIRPFSSREHEKKFPNWNELFRYLKQEITDIKASDANILSNLRAIENELSCVKDSRENSQNRFD